MNTAFNANSPATTNDQMIEGSPNLPQKSAEARIKSMKDCVVPRLARPFGQFADALNQLVLDGLV